ncbi:MAG TPA: MauE/DoxX family redox-associated membrane protein [Pseudonocardiaceae bacterium]|nr:MauE/DoxX family redox-associated membrane protein [Pseudonocardiaceae bacterium]
MMETLIGGARLAVAVLLGIAGVAKLVNRNPRLTGSALANLVGTQRVAVVWRLVGVAELIVAVLVLALPAGPIVGCVWSAGLVAYLGYAKIAAPGSSCGCLGSRSAPVSGRAFWRVGVLLAASAVGIVRSPVGVSAAAVALPLVLIMLGLSAELDSYWLLPLRSWRLRRRHPLAASGEFTVPVASTVRQLQQSPAYRSVAGWLRSDLLDAWDEGSWRVLSYAAVRDSERLTAVFAVPRLAYQPEQVKVALVAA